MARTLNPFSPAATLPDVLHPPGEVTVAYVVHAQGNKLGSCVRMFRGNQCLQFQHTGLAGFEKDQHFRAALEFFLPPVV